MCNRWSGLQFWGPNCKGTIAVQLYHGPLPPFSWRPFCTRSNNDPSVCADLIFYSPQQLNLSTFDEQELDRIPHQGTTDLFKKPLQTLKEKTFCNSRYAKWTRVRAVTGQSRNTSTKLPHPRSPAKICYTHSQPHQCLWPISISNHLYAMFASDKQITWMFQYLNVAQYLNHINKVLCRKQLRTSTPEGSWCQTPTFL